MKKHIREYDEHHIKIFWISYFRRVPKIQSNACQTWIIMFKLIAKNYHVNVTIKQKREIWWAYYHKKTHLKTRRTLYRNILNIIFSTSINQKFNLTFVELEWVMFELDLIMFKFIAKNYHVNVMIKRKLNILWVCYFEEHIREREKHRDETYHERHIHSKHRIETSK